MSVKWEEPPVGGLSDTANKYVELRATLKKSPGKSALVRDWPKGAKPGLASNRRFVLARGACWEGFELTAGRRANGTQTLHAKYVGE